MKGALQSMAETAAAYEAASQTVVFTSVALAFVGVGWSLLLMLRPKTCGMCVWSMGVFSLAWLVDATTHLLGVSGHVTLEVARYGIWVAVGLFGLGLALGVLGVLAYVRNEHRYERGLVIGVFATLANMWVVGGVVMALRQDQVASIGRGLVIPLMQTGGPIDEPALLARLAGRPAEQDAAKALRLSGMLARVVSDLASGLSDERSARWVIADDLADDDGARVLAALRRVHAQSQQRLALTTEPGWMSLALTEVEAGGDVVAERARAAEAALTAQRLALMPQRRLRAMRTHRAGFEVIRTTTEASIKGVAGALIFDFWVAVAGGHAVEVWACSTSESPEFFDATETLITDLLRTLQRDGVAGPRYSQAVQYQMEIPHRLEKSGHFDDALTAWRQAALAAPSDAEVLLGVIRCGWKVGQTKETLAWIDEHGAGTPDGVAASIGVLRLRTAAGEIEARDRLADHFQGGLADDEALAALILGYLGNDDPASAQATLTSFGDRHAATLVAWWQGFLATPAATASVATPLADDSKASMSTDAPTAARPTPAATPPAPTRRSR